MKIKENRVTIVQCYVPTKATEENQNKAFYDTFSRTLSNLKKQNIIMLMGDLTQELEPAQMILKTSRKQRNGTSKQKLRIAT